MEVRRGDIYMADISNVSDESKIRPVLIVQNDKGNAHSTSFIAAVITSRKKKDLPTHVCMRSVGGLRKESTVLCEHLVTLSKEMLREYVGTIVNTDYEPKINKALQVSLQLKK